MPASSDHANNFRLLCLSAQNFDVRFRHCTFLREKTDQLSIGSAVLRNRGDINLQRAICKRAFHFRPRRAGMDPDGECHCSFPLKR